MLREVSFERLKQNLRNYLASFRNNSSLKEKSQIKNRIFTDVEFSKKYEEINLKKAFFEPSSYSQMVNEERFLTSIIQEGFLTLEYIDSIENERETIYENKVEEVKDRIKRIKAKIGMLLSAEEAYRKIQVESFQDGNRIKSSTLDIDLKHGIATLPASSKSFLQVKKYIIKRDSDGVIGTPSGRNNTLTALSKSNKESFSFYKNKESKLVIEGEFKGGLQVVNGLVIKISEESKVGSVILESIRLNDSDELLDFSVNIKESYRNIIAPREADKFKLTFKQDAAYYFNDEPIFQIDLKEIYFESYKYSSEGRVDFHAFQCNPEWMYGIATKVHANMLKVCDLKHITNGREHDGETSSEYFAEGLNSVECSLSLKRKEIKILNEKEEQAFSFKKEHVERFNSSNTRTLRSSVEDLAMTRVYLNLETPFRYTVANNQVRTFQLEAVESDEREVRILGSNQEEIYAESSYSSEGSTIISVESNYSGTASYSRKVKNINFIERVSDFLLEVNNVNTILGKSYIEIYNSDKLKNIDFKVSIIEGKEYLLFNKEDFDVFYESKSALNEMILNGAIRNSIVCEGVELVEYIDGDSEFKNKETRTLSIPATEEELIEIEVVGIENKAALYQYGTHLKDIEILENVEIESLVSGDAKYERSSGILYYKRKDDGLSEGYSVQWEIENNNTKTSMSFDTKEEKLHFSENIDLTNRIVKYKKVKETIKLTLGSLCEFESSEEGYIEVKIPSNISRELRNKELIQIELEEVGVDVSDMLTYATPVIRKVEHFIS